MRKYTLRLVSVLAFLLVPMVSFAAQLEAGERYMLSSGQTVSQNLYAAGSDVVVAGTVEGDAFLAGGTVTMSGTVQKDLFIGGGTVTMNGTVQEDLRIGGGTIFITGTANGDVMIFGGQVTITKDAKLAKDLYINGGQVTIDGTLSGPLTINAGAVFINGTVEGTITSQSEDMQISSTARIQGDLNHRGFKDPVIAEGATITGTTNFTKVTRPDAKQAVPFIQAWWLMKVAMLLVAALVFMLLAGKYNAKFVQGAMGNFGREVLRGFILLIMVPVACLLGLITVVGTPLVMILGLLYVLSIALACIYANILTGSLFYKLLMKKAEQAINWQTIVVGVVVLQVIKLIPIVGWIVAGLIFLASLGTLWNSAYKSLQAQR